VLAAIDAAAAALRNTRAVARAHYVHPEVINGYTSGDLERFLTGRRPRPARWLDTDEQLLLAYLADSLDRRAADLV
jgi:DNA topoisomerase-1